MSCDVHIFLYRPFYYFISCLFLRHSQPMTNQILHREISRYTNPKHTLFSFFTSDGWRTSVFTHLKPVHATAHHPIVVHQIFTSWETFVTRTFSTSDLWYIPKEEGVFYAVMDAMSSTRVIVYRLIDVRILFADVFFITIWYQQFLISFIPMMK